MLYPMKATFKMISRWTHILNKGYPTSIYMRSLIRSLPSKWRPMVTTSMWQGNSEEDELPLISRRLNHLWKHRKGRRSNEGPSNVKGRFKSTTGQKKERPKKFYKKNKQQIHLWPE